MEGYSTPKTKRRSENFEQYSPVILSESPAATVQQKNLTGIPRLVRDLAAELYNTIQQWNSFHIEGASIVKEIASIKTTNINKYTEDLERLCNALTNIVNCLQQKESLLHEINNKTSALINLNKSLSPIFITWTIPKIIDVVDLISRSYKQEIIIKRIVLENIAHSQSKEEAMFHAVCWTIQPFIDNIVSISLESLLTETGHRKIK